MSYKYKPRLHVRLEISSTPERWLANLNTLECSLTAITSQKPVSSTILTEKSSCSQVFLVSVELVTFSMGLVGVSRKSPKDTHRPVSSQINSVGQLLHDS